MKAVGEECGLYYDTTLSVDVGDVLETSTGRRYLVLTSRRQQNRPRWHLRCVVMGETDPMPDGAVIHPLYWYSRDRNKGGERARR
jgi:hypothetical protein